MGKLYSYVVEHDHGFAPNPFWGYCTLANCKPKIRKHAKIGDRIIGTGSSKDNLQGHLIYWMIVEKIIDFDEYWHNTEHANKKPVLNGSKIQQFGDNIYYKNNEGEFVQADSFHSKKGGILCEKNRSRDTGRTENVLIGRRFSYLGRTGPKVPDHLKIFVKKGPSHKCKFSTSQIVAMDNWLDSVAPDGVLGEPVRWQTKIK